MVVGRPVIRSALGWPTRATALQGRCIGSDLFATLDLHEMSFVDHELDGAKAQALKGPAHIRKRIVERHA